MMEKLPNNIKRDIFEVPEGYHELLAERILERKAKQNTRNITVRWAAAAVLVLGTALFLINGKFQIPSSDHTAFLLDTEIEWLIENGDWSEEDILTYSDNPNAVIEQFMEEQWSSYDLEEEEMERVMLNK